MVTVSDRLREARSLLRPYRRELSPELYKKLLTMVACTLSTWKPEARVVDLLRG